MTRKVLDFLASPTGKFAGFGLVVVIGMLAFNYYKSLPEAKKKEEASKFNDAIEIDRTYSRHRDGFSADVDSGQVKTKLEKDLETKKEALDKKEKEIETLQEALAEEKTKQATEEASQKLQKMKAPVVRAQVSQPVKQTVSPKFSVSPLSLFESKPVKAQSVEKLSDTYAPYGRLIKCQLVNTVDSANMETPVIALVTNDVHHNGKVVIPAGTELHGTAQSATIRNRIATEKDWIFVWRTQTADNGKELKVQGIALDYAQNINTKRYDITDGSAGLRGFEIATDEYAELKLYAALFMKGVGEGVTDLLLEEAKSQDLNTFVGDGNTGSTEDKDQAEKDQIKVGMAKGAEEVADTYAQRMLDAISRDGVYIRVPAGTTFYLYVQQTIDKAHAAPGATIGFSAKKGADGEERQNQQNNQLNSVMLELIRQRSRDREIRHQEQVRKEQVQ